MKLRFRMVVSVLCGFRGLAVTLFLYVRISVGNAFAGIDVENMRDGAHMTLRLYENELTHLVETGMKWTDDRTIRQIAQTPDGDAEARLDEAYHREFVDYDLNLVVIAGANGGIAATRYFDLEEQTAVEVPDDVLAFIKRDSHLRRHLRVRNRIKGVVIMGSSPMMVVSLPVLPEQDDGLVQGALILARKFENTDFIKLAEDLGFRMFHQQLDQDLTQDFREARKRLSATSPIYARQLSESATAAYLLLEDIYGEPGFIVRLSRPRYGYMEAFTTFSRASVFTLISGSVVLLVVVLLTEFGVVARLRTLVREIAESKSLEHI